MNTSLRSALIVADSRAVQAWLQQTAGEVLDFRAVDPEPAATLIERIRAAGAADLLFCEFAPEFLSERVALVESLGEQLPALPVVGIGLQDDAQHILAAMRAGARDYFVVGRDAGLAAQLARLLRRSAGAATTPAVGTARQSRVYTVLSGRPYDGTAFLAEHLSLALQEALAASGERVLLIDLATPAGAAAIFLNLNQSYSVLDAIGDAYRCDQTLVDTAFSKHASGLHLLSLPEDLLGRPDLPADDVAQLLQVLRGLFSAIVIAADGNLPIGLVARLIEQSDRTLLLTDQSILKSRYHKYLLRALRLESCPLDRMGLVVDNYRRRLGLDPKNLAELFELPLLATLQTDGYNRIVSMNSGEPLYTLAKKDPYCTSVRTLVGLLTSGRVAEPRPAGVLDRWLGR